MTSWSYEDTGLPTDALQISGVTVTPDPPKPGADAKLTIRGTVQAAVEDGASIDVTVKLGLIKLLQKRFDLFEELRNGSPTSGWSVTPDPAGGPIKPGEIELTYALSPLTREIPRAKFNVTAAAYTADEDDLASLRFQFDFMTPGF
ncbi:ML domain-containing protein [Streptomyces globisporus]|uniref:ML domain-containing protein n=1 Tax=Streptomyces globisporus TaxID=1908 RepID=UPI0004CA8E23|nr:ML domain-containing protein [Streptomyces globisporus]